MADSENMVIREARKFTERYGVVYYAGRAMVLIEEPFQHYEVLTKDRFERLIYPGVHNPSRSKVSDIFSYLVNTAPDVTDKGHLVLLGGQAFDTRSLEFVDVPREEIVWRSPYDPVFPATPIPFLMDLAGGSEDIYGDMVQSMAPLLMHKKPDGVFWWVGSGSNGKSSLMEALYRIFPGQLASLTVKGLTDGRDTPMLNGHMANVVKESSEGHVEDTQVYKSIGTHEDFYVHKFHSQDAARIDGNKHHIFSANQVPTFNDKGHSAKRRTFIIKFTQQFETDPTFNDRTFTEEMLGSLLGEMIRVAREIRSRDYRFMFSVVTNDAKLEYDAEANNAEEFGRSLRSRGIVGFQSFNPVRLHYENWCAEHGYTALGVANMRRALMACGFKRRNVRVGGGDPVTMYVLDEIEASDLSAMGLQMRGFYTSKGFVPESIVQEWKAEEEERQGSLEDGW